MVYNNHSLDNIYSQAQTANYPSQEYLKPVDKHRAQLGESFDFKYQILNIYDQEQKCQILAEQLEKAERELEKLRGQLPEEIITLYDRDRIVSKLQGSKDKAQ